MAKQLQFLVLHCLATPEGREVTKADLTQWHLAPVAQGGRGWKQYGYRAFIHLDGTIEHLIENNNDNIVDPWEISNGVRGINSISNHIAYVGGTDKKGKPKDTRTSQQWMAMAEFVYDFVENHPQVKVAGHYQFDSGKACPSFDVPKFCEEIGIPDENIYRGK